MMIFPAFIIMTGVMIYPLIYSFYNSFFYYRITEPHSYHFVKLSNYIKLFIDPLFLHSFKITFICVLSAVAGEFVIAIIMALLLNKSFKGREIFKILYLLPITVPPVVVGLGWKFLYNPQSGMVNYFLRVFGFDGLDWIGDYDMALMSVILVDIWEWTPFLMIIFFAGLKSLPKDLNEVASIDGANSVQRFIFITVPYLSRLFVIACFLRVVDAFKFMFDVVYIMTGGGPGDATEILSIYIYRQGFRYFDIGYSAAISFILLLVIIGLLVPVSRSL